ncbi:MAG: tRNA (adenosine(37)-N6)-dimethylallyltransferase MiaA [Rickettsiales bacterium]|jgi:tRNA dimethylallyltransferase|nr:tRNA (adenosine(37)-N6)-dimethylallyltransferase MiaA [Rickettsiales bacterium]
MEKRAFVVAGPTASGKSDFAHKIAKALNGTVINVDSVQIYKGIETLSASPLAGLSNIDPDNCAVDGVPHKLFSIRELWDQITVTDYLKLAHEEYERAEVPVFVGGSGYYIGAIVNGMSPIPEVSDENRERARKMVMETPDAAKALLAFEFTDPQRMMRALEVFLETGRPISEWQQLPRRGAIAPTPVKILIMPHRDVLAPRIRERLRAMIRNGAINEVRKYVTLTDRAIGIDELSRVIRGEAQLEESLENLAVRTEQYAKRQRTWFRNQFDPDMSIYRIPTEKDLENVLQGRYSKGVDPECDQ